MNPSATQILSSFLADFTLDMLPYHSLVTARHCMLDYFAAAWNAQGRKHLPMYLDTAMALGGKGRSPIIGAGTTTPYWAAFANGAAGHVTEVDDVHRVSTMHIGVAVAPVVLALAGELALSGTRILESLVCGYEAAIRVGECLGRTHYATFHTTGTAGSFGAAAAAAKALGLDAEKTAHALGHAGTQANALWQFLDDGAVTAKPFHPGKAAQNGITAASLAAHGVPGASHILEGKRGLCSYATKAPDVEAVTRNLGAPYKLDEVCFKSYPTCGQTHSMLDALRVIKTEHALTSADVREVEARVYQQAISIAGIADPKNLEEAKFSNQICLAMMLVKGDVNFANMTWEAASDPQVREMSKRVRLVLDPEIDAKFPATRPCRIIVRTTDGREFSRENLYRTGDPEKPMTTAQMQAKFRELSGHVLPVEKQDMIIRWCLHLPKGKAHRRLFRAT